MADSYAGPNALEYAKNLPAAEGDGGHAAELARQAEINDKLMKNEGTENPFKLWRELGETTTKHATVIRYNKGLKQADEKIVELLDRYKKVNLSDRSQWANTTFAFARQLKNMLELSRTVVLGALLRDESRGAHYKPEFPDRNDERFLKTTKASFPATWPVRASSTKRWTRNTSSRVRAVTTQQNRAACGGVLDEFSDRMISYFELMRSQVPKSGPGAPAIGTRTSGKRRKIKREK